MRFPKLSKRKMSLNFSSKGYKRGNSRFKILSQNHNWSLKCKCPSQCLFHNYLNLSKHLCQYLKCRITKRKFFQKLFKSPIKLRLLKGNWLKKNFLPNQSQFPNWISKRKNLLSVSFKMAHLVTLNQRSWLILTRKGRSFNHYELAQDLPESFQSIQLNLRLLDANLPLQLLKKSWEIRQHFEEAKLYLLKTKSRKSILKKIKSKSLQFLKCLNLT